MGIESRLKEIVGERNYQNMIKVIKERFSRTRAQTLIAINPAQCNFKYFISVERGVIRQLFEGNRSNWEIFSDKKGVIVINPETGSIVLTIYPNIIWSC